MKYLLTESKAARLLTFFAFTVLFMAETYLLSQHMPDLFSRANLVEHTLLLIALGIASFRGGRAISGNGIFDWLRHGLCVESADSSGAGNSTGPKYELGALSVIGQAICCPICSGTWSAVCLLTLYAFIPAWGAILIYLLAAAGIGEYLVYATEKNEWEGRLARERAGSEWLGKNPVEKWPDSVQAMLSPSAQRWLQVTRDTQSSWKEQLH